jgi:hypothetical protein
MNKYLIEKKNAHRARRALHKEYLTYLLNFKRKVSIYTGEPEPLKDYLIGLRVIREIHRYNYRYGRKYIKELEKEEKRS